MHSTSDFKKGLTLLINGQPYSLLDFQHHKPGKGNAVTRVKLRNLITGSYLEKTVKSADKWEVPDIEYKEMSYLYKDDQGFHFMDQILYDQICLPKSLIADVVYYLTENIEVKVCFFENRAVSIQVPKSIHLKVTATDPGFKGNTVSNTTKSATLETGLVVSVPLHIKEGDTLKIQTENGSYIERVNS